MASIPNSKLLALGSRASCWLLWRTGLLPLGVEKSEVSIIRAQKLRESTLRAFQHLRISTWYDILGLPVHKRQERALSGPYS